MEIQRYLIQKNWTIVDMVSRKYEALKLAKEAQGEPYTYVLVFDLKWKELIYEWTY